jgi:hypothetical protein
MSGDNKAVIPGHAKREPGIHKHDRKYGFSDVQLHIAAAPRWRVPEWRAVNFDPPRNWLFRLPDGQITQWPVQPLSQKYSDFQKPQITCISIAVSLPQEGRLAIVTDVGSGMRWTRIVLLTRASIRGR